MQRAWFNSFPPRSCTYLSSWGWETASISFSPHWGFNRFGMDNCKSRQQKPAVQLSAAHHAKAAHSSPITGFLSGNRHSLMITCFWVCLMKLSLCNCSRKKCTRRAGTACCRTSRQHRAGGFDHTAVLVLAHVLSATRSTTSLVSSLKSRGFREAVQCLCAGTPPKTQKTRTLPSLHLCALMKGHSIPNTLLPGTDTTSSQH